MKNFGLGIFGLLLLCCAAHAQEQPFDSPCKKLFNARYKGLDERKRWVNEVCNKNTLATEKRIAEYRKTNESKFKEETQYVEALNRVSGVISSLNEYRSRRHAITQLCDQNPGNYLWCIREVSTQRSQYGKIFNELSSARQKVEKLPESTRKIELTQRLDKAEQLNIKIATSFSNVQLK